MPRYQTEPSYTHVTNAKTCILLPNLGTPVAPTKQALKPYLKQLLSHPLVVETTRVLRSLVMNCLILKTRPKKYPSKKPYMKL